MIHKSQPKRHHFVPEMLQRRFADANGHLHFFNKATPDRGVMPIAPGNLHVERHLYSRILDDGTKDTTLEEQYSQLEGHADSLIRQMLTQVTEGICPRLREEETLLWITFVYEQWRRVPDMHHRFMPESSAGDFVSSAISDYESRYGEILSDALREKFLSPGYLAKFRQNARVGALSRRSDKVLDALSRKGLFFAVCSQNSGFVLGSSPVLKLTPVTNDLAHPSVEIWLPITHHVAAVLGGDPFDGQIVEVNRSKVGAINLEIAKRSTLFASHSPQITRSIAKRLP